MPRYAYVGDDLLVVSGNGGEIMVFKHSGSAVTPTLVATPSIIPASSSMPSITLNPTPSPTINTKYDLNNDGLVDLRYVITLIVAIFN